MAAMARSMIPPAGVRFADGVESLAGNRTVRNRGVSCGARRWKIGRLRSEFSDSQHTQYYVSSRARCGAKEKEMKKEAKTENKNKKKLKLLKRLSSDLQMFESDDAGGMIISEAQKVLLAELEKLRTAEMEKKGAKMEEKALMKSCKSSESSSSSSESSDSDCGNNMVMKSRPKESVSVTRESRLMMGTLPLVEVEREEEEERNAVSTVVESNSRGASRKIEVCMGGKCKKQGAMALMEDFQRKVGEEAVVVTCKCMGQCKNAPNVRVSPASCVEDGNLGEKLVCIGVGLEDVDTIVADIMGASKSSPQQAAMANC